MNAEMIDSEKTFLSQRRWLHRVESRLLCHSLRQSSRKECSFSPPIRKRRRSIDFCRQGATEKRDYNQGTGEKREKGQERGKVTHGKATIEGG